MANDPYAGLGTVVEQAPEQDPYAGLGTVVSGPIVARPKPPEPTWDETLNQWVGVGARALEPYATAATLGGAAGAPFAGIGAAPGAAGGVLALGLTDIGTSLYNAAAPMWGGQRVPTGSEAIQNIYSEVGLGRRPETPAQQVFSNTLEGASAGLAQPLALGVQAARTATPLARNIMAELAKQPVAQMAAGGGAAAAPSVAQNYFDVNDPLALAGLSLAGGAAGGYAGAQRPTKVTKADLEDITTDAYKAAEQAGVNVSAQAMSDLEAKADALLQQFSYKPNFHKLAAEARQLFADEAGKPMSFKTLEEFRKVVRDLPYSEGGAARGTKAQRAMVGQLSDTINDFMMNLQPAQTTSGDPMAAAAYLTKARDAARKNFEADLIEMTAERAGQKQTGTAASNLRKAFGNIAAKPSRMNRLTEETQAGINAMAAGKGFKGKQAIGKAAPPLDWRGIPAMLSTGAGAAYLGHPELAGLEFLYGLGTHAAKAGANRAARSQVNAMANTARGTPAFQLPAAQIGAQTAQQIVPDSRLPAAWDSGDGLNFTVTDDSPPTPEVMAGWPRTSRGDFISPTTGNVFDAAGNRTGLRLPLNISQNRR